MSTDSLPRTNENVPPEPLIDGAFCAIVETGSGFARRRLYFSLQSASAAVARARKAGLRARIVVCELKPLGGVE